MAMAASDIERLIRARIPDAEVTIQDLAGDGDHYKATIIAESFRGKSRVQQHQIYEALNADCTPWRCKPERRSAKAARSERLRRSPGWVIPGIAFSDKPVRRRQGGRSPGHLTM
jgi:acid stress-induced BolA-like protein IbaG/YrbA